MKEAEVLVYNYTGKKLFVKKKEIVRIVKEILNILKEKRSVSLALIFLKKGEIKKLNFFWRKENKETTILSFPLLNKKEPFNDKQIDLGDIFLAPEVIKKRAKELKVPLKDYFFNLLIHGICHLYGFSHKTETKRKRMERVEGRIRKSLLKDNF
ncbi:MAG: rRNA maturation RNase YbeY [Candidatus Paceibacterota bacterium]